MRTGLSEDDIYFIHTTSKTENLKIVTFIMKFLP